jgi:hypothetical protein
MIALFLGAGFSKFWGLLLAPEVMNMEFINQLAFPGKWQRTLLKEIKHLWEARAGEHNNIVDQFARSLYTSDSDAFQKFVSFLALRFSSKHWHIGTASATKWGTGDHVRRQRSIPPQYSLFLKIIGTANLRGIVTTNYDVVVEKLLGPLASGRLGGFHYGMPGEQLAGRHPVSAKDSYRHVTVTGKVPLLKLHGSLNWELSEEDKIVKYVDCRPSRGRRYQAGIQSLLVPPGGSPMSNALQPTWDHAREVLKNSEVWVFCGYSLPEYDSRIHDLLGESASGKVSKVCVCDINPTPVCEKLSMILRHEKPTVQLCKCPGITEEFGQEHASKLARAIVCA